MTSKPPILRELARRDIEAAVDFYAVEAGEHLALRFVDALEGALRTIGQHPAAGSPRLGQELDLPGLRAHVVKGFPYLVCYVEQQDHVDIWRLLHGHRDIPEWLQEPDS
ncbi:MAG: plasmid stabilization protein [Phenylobacterium sp.]|jgi:toxin ParE1/3/4|nr:plasmid stabilization protein [Phenylobacterium sp.]